MTPASTPVHCYSPGWGTQVCHADVGRVGSTPLPSNAKGYIPANPPSPPAGLHCYHPGPHMTVCGPPQAAYDLLTFSVWGALFLSLLLTAAGLRWRKSFLLALAAAFSAWFALVGPAFTPFWLVLIPIPIAQIWGAVRLQGQPSAGAAEDHPAGPPLAPLPAMLQALLRPAATFRRLPPGLPFLRPGIVLALVNTVLLASMLPPVSAGQGMGLSLVVRAFMLATAGFLSPWVSWGTTALALYLAGFLLCPGRNRFLHWYTIAVYAYPPYFLERLVSLPFQLLTRAPFWPIPLNAAALLPPSLEFSFVHRFLLFVTPSTLWYLFILGEGFASFGRLPRWKGAATAAGLWLIQISFTAFMMGAI